jgi:hypothetical protein
MLPEQLSRAGLDLMAVRLRQRITQIRAVAAVSRIVGAPWYGFIADRLTTMRSADEAAPWSLRHLGL